MPLLHSRGENGVVHLLCLSGEGTATGWATSRLVWVTGKKGSVVFIVLCLRESPAHPSDLIWYHTLFSILKVSEGFLSFFLLLKHMSLLHWWSFYLEDYKSHSESKGVPEGQILTLTWRKREVTVQYDVAWNGLETFSRCFVVFCRRFVAQECFNRNMEAMPWS